MNNLYAFVDFKKNKLIKNFFLKIISFSISVFIIHFGKIEQLFGKESLDDDNLEEILSGFDDEEKFFEKNLEKKTENVEKELSNIYGNIGLKLSYSYNEEEPSNIGENVWSGLNKFQTFLSLTYDLELGENWKSRISGKFFYDYVYGFKGRENFSQEVLDDLEKEVEFRELYLEGILFKNLDIKIGKQIIAWGVANSLRVVDVLNPTDNRELGMVDLEDSRIPINMTRLDYFFGDIKLEFVAVHEIKFNKSAPSGSDFNPSNHTLYEVIPESNAENTEYGLAILGTFSRWDFSLHWADYFNDNAHYQIGSISVVPGMAIIPKYELHHSRMNMIGITFSIPFGNLLLKAETAKLEGIKVSHFPEKSFSRLDLLLGIEYSGFAETSISIESGLQHLNDFEPRLQDIPDVMLEDNYVTSLNFVQDYLNNSVNLTLSGMMVGQSGQQGGVNQVSLKHEIFDSFYVKGGMIVYQTGKSELFKSLNRNDRFFSEIRYSF